MSGTLFFTGAGMSAESGVPTYRGRGGIWGQYRWEDFACQRAFARRRCAQCDAPLRPDIVWFEDALDPRVFARAEALIRRCDTFVAVGTSAVVYPAAGPIPVARAAGAHMIELNVDDTELSHLFDEHWRGTAGALLAEHFPLSQHREAS